MKLQAIILDIEPSIQAVIRFKAAQLVRSGYGYSPDDRDDLQQDLWLDAFVRSRKYDPTRSSRGTFVNRLVSNHAATLLEARTAGCRDYRACTRSLDEPVGQDGVAAFGQTLSTDEYESRIGHASMSSVQHSEMRADVESVIASLSPDLASVAELLMSMGVVDVARRLKVSRATVYRRISHIREVFEAAGFRSAYSRSVIKVIPRRVSAHRKQFKNEQRDLLNNGFKRRSDERLPNSIC
jgi:RNA polymerase sigma-70 factor (ECF subfamily)